MNKKVSIIVPIYNASLFLNKGVESLIKQTYKNIEIILLNDGSKDNSYELMKKWNNKYPDIIKIYSHKNIGAGKTRNKGIKLSTGDYITFMDSDDYLEKDYIERLITEIGNNDIIVSGYKKVNMQDKLINVQSLNPKSKWSKFKQVSVCSKMYKRKFLLSNKIEYKELKIAEDILFCITAYSKTDKIATTPYFGYVIVENENSITHNQKIKIETDVIQILNLLHKEISKNNVFMISNLKYIKYLYFKLFTYFLIDKSKVMNFKDLEIFYINCMNWIKETFKNNNLNLKFIWEKAEPFNVNIAINLVLLSEKIKTRKILIKVLKGVFHEK